MLSKIGIMPGSIDLGGNWSFLLLSICNNLSWLYLSREDLYGGLSLFDILAQFLSFPRNIYHLCMSSYFL